MTLIDLKVLKIAAFLYQVELTIYFHFRYDDLVFLPTMALSRCHLVALVTMSFYQYDVLTDVRMIYEPIKIKRNIEWRNLVSFYKFIQKYAF
jgi:hypothetical protein